jgi:hypothetical protein
LGHCSGCHSCQNQECVDFLHVVLIINRLIE